MAAGISPEERRVAVKVLAAFFQPAVTEAGLAFGDIVKGWRSRNLVRVLCKTDQKLRDRGLRPEEARRIRLSVGLPLLERASYQDDDVLQQMWANLMVSSVAEGSGIDDFSLDVMLIEVMHQMCRADCEVLKYLVDNGVEGYSSRGSERTLRVRPVSLESLHEVHHIAHVSLEKLICLGCAAKQISIPLKTNDGLGSELLVHKVVPTLVGLNFYTAASGEWPLKLREDGDRS